MLDPVHPWGRPVRRALASDVRARVAAEAWEIDGYYRVRREIFADEQALFEESDRDLYDEHATPIVAVSQIAGMADEVVGVVRIYQSEPGIWFGGRLGVGRDYRRRGDVGSALITTAVSSAHAWGAVRFFATVQSRNVRYFERHDFRVLREVEVCGLPHAFMEAALASYPPCPRALEMARLGGAPRRAA